jgi:hypothetical protein
VSKTQCARSSGEPGRAEYVQQKTNAAVKAAFYFVVQRWCG